MGERAGEASAGDDGERPLGADAFAWLRGRLRRFLERHATRLTQSGGRLDDLFVSAREANALLGDADEAAAFVAPTLTGRLAGLVSRYRLSPLESAALVAALAPALDVDIARLYTFAWADFTLKQPAVGFIGELIADDPLAGHRALQPRGALVAAGLVQVQPTAAWGGAGPRLHRGVVPHPALVAWLTGEAPWWPPALAAAIDDAPPSPTPPCLADGVDAALRTALRGRRIGLIGPRSVGRRSAFVHCLAPRPVWICDPRRVEDDVASELVDLGVAARLVDAALLLRVDGLPAERQAIWLRAALRLDPHVTLAITADKASALRTVFDAAPIVDFPLPAPEALRAMWRAVLPDDAAAVEGVATRYVVPPGNIVRAAQAASASGAVTEESLGRAVQTGIRHALDAVAEPVATTLTWDDVVLPDDVIGQLEEIRSQARNRRLVFDEWGFRGKLAYGRGLACLFSGPPGTGKTMMAGVLARELGRTLYRVDLSRVVSKWIGETEKNLARLFDEAQKAQIVLFFDEADSLFSSRTEVKGANDRFANMEVNYLLQRMEQFDGMSILTTNFERGLDSAFKRRLRFRVHFPMPDAEARATLWQRVLPARLPIEGEVRWAALGKRYKLSGGHIKNAALRAAFYAADAGRSLTEADLVRAAEAEQREIGRL